MKKLLQKSKEYIEKHGINIVLITFFLLVFPNVLDEFIRLPQLLFTIIYGSGLVMLIGISFYLLFKKNELDKNKK